MTFQDLALIVAIDSFADLIGILGVATYLVAYFALQVGWIRGQGYAYPALNLLAATCLLYHLRTDFNLPAALIQVSFVAISLVGIARIGLAAHWFRFTDD